MPQRNLDVLLGGYRDAVHPLVGLHEHALKISVVLASLSWVNAAAVSNALSIVTAIGTSILFLYLYVKSKLYEADRQRRRQDLDDELDEMKRRDAAQREIDKTRHESLTYELEQLKQKAAEDAAESHENQERMRDSLHVIRNDLQQRILENAALRRDLESANHNFIEASRQLTVSNEHNAVLTHEVSRLTGEVTRLNAEVSRLSQDVTSAVCRFEKESEREREREAKAGGDAA